ncbi:cytochrome P450 [Saccharothrix obliqua]|uniref:cytochrome P450 n=1 Tax=Saccharothrix obliqua TaxID=2861747 RepID=UPI001C5D4BE4|nr:cytochrome P450 [Saccharothrix obliqua]MBW4718760.1 cytochrome P450 [Saccharothrix obliqua]
MTMTLALTAERFSHNESDYISDPFDFYAKMRAEQPAYQSDRVFGGAWLFFRHADCRHLIRDERLSNNRSDVPLRFLPPDRRVEFDDMVGVLGRWFAFHDGESHRRLRRYVHRGYQPLGGERLHRSIQATVDALLAGLPGDEFDLMSELAFPLPAIVIADLLGVPAEAHAELIRWTDDIAQLLGSTQVTEEFALRARASTEELVAFLSSAESLRSSERQGGLLHAMRAVGGPDDSLDDEDVIAQAALLLFAGTASIRYLIGNSVRAVDQAPPGAKELLVDPRTAPAAVEELLRYCNPVQFVGRVAREDFAYEYDDGRYAEIRAGQPVMLYTASANRDSDKFPRADELVLTRPLPNEHLTLGSGLHLCFGDPLVRATTRTALATLYTRLPHLRVPDQEIDWNNNLGFRGPQALRVVAA